MARDVRLRYDDRGRPAVPSVLQCRDTSSLVLIAAILAIAVVTVLAAHSVGSHQRGGHKATAPAFLSKQLGSSQAHGSLVREPAPNVSVAIANDGLSVTDAEGASPPSASPAAASRR